MNFLKNFKDHSRKALHKQNYALESEKDRIKAFSIDCNYIGVFGIANKELCNTRNDTKNFTDDV